MFHTSPDLAVNNRFNTKVLMKKYKSPFNQETNTPELYTFSVSSEKPKPPFITKLPRFKIGLKRKCRYAQLIKIRFYHLNYIIHLKYGKCIMEESCLRGSLQIICVLCTVPHIFASTGRHSL